MAQHDALQEECVDAEVPGVQNVAKYWGLYSKAPVLTSASS